MYSDNQGLKMLINLEKFNRGKGYFNSNNSLLTVPILVDELNQMENLIDLILFNATPLT